MPYQGLSTNFRAFVVNLHKILIPNNIHEALKSLEWKADVLEEILALEYNETWEIIGLLMGNCLVGCKWIFTMICGGDRSIGWFKACLVLKGFTQSFRIDYE